MAGLVVTNGICFILLLAQCHPLHTYWDQEDGTCWSVYKVSRDFLWNFEPDIPASQRLYNHTAGTSQTFKFWFWQEGSRVG